MFSLIYGKYSKCPPVAPMQAWRRLRHWSMPSSITLCSTRTHIHQLDAASNRSYPALLSGRLTAPDFVTNCIEVRTFQWPEIWKFIRLSYIIALSGWRQWMMHRTSGQRQLAEKDNEQQKLSKMIT